MRRTPSLRTLRRTLGGLWPAALVAAVAFVPFVRGLWPGRIFFLRDLTTYYWPFHLWARQTREAGGSLLWDPHLAFGQASIAEAPRLLLFPPALLLRLFEPPELWFNVLVSLPFPVAGVGALLLFGRRMSRAGAVTGALVFVTAGPILSTSNFPNLSWAVAFLPWTLWAVDRMVERARWVRFACVATFFALQAISGEPVTLVFGAALVMTYVAMVAAPWPDRRGALVALRNTALAGLAGVLLASIQALPLADASSRSARALVSQHHATLLSIHPLSLLETVMPWIFGSYLERGTTSSPWLWALTDATWPFYMSLYVGLGALVLAAIGLVCHRSRWTMFWAFAGVALTIFAFGRHTPIYLVVREALPIIGSFRFPAKYFVFPVLSLAALAAVGAEALFRSDIRARVQSVTRGLAVALLVLTGAAGAVALVATTAPEATARTLASMASSSRLERRADLSNPDDAPNLVGPAGRLALLACASALLMLGVRSGSSLARASLIAATVLDPLVTNISVCPTTDVGLLGPPGWVAVTRAHPTDRVYVGARPMQSLAGSQPDPDFAGPRQLPVDALRTQVELESGLDAQFA